MEHVDGEITQDDVDGLIAELENLKMLEAVDSLNEEERKELRRLEKQAREWGV